jgi:hypothetical protein
MATGTMLLRMISRRNEQKMREPAETLVPPCGRRLRRTMVWKGGSSQRRYFVARCEAGVLAQTRVGLGLFVFGDI